MKYFELTKNLPPHKLTVEAFKHVQNPYSSLDIGAGAFRDTNFLLKNFPVVFAIDKAEFKHKDYSNLIYFNQNIKSFVFPENLDFINAMYILSFLSEKDFKKVWPKIITSFAPKGVFCGTFFGIEDEWATNKKMTFFKEVKSLFKGFKILHHKEIKKQGELADGTPHYWHYYEIIAIKKP